MAHPRRRWGLLAAKLPLTIVAVLVIITVGLAVFLLRPSDRGDAEFEAEFPVEPAVEGHQFDSSELDPQVLSVPMLGSTTPSPGPEWVRAAGSDDPAGLARRADEFELRASDGWVSYFGVFVYGYLFTSDQDSAELSDLDAMTETVLQYWTDTALSTVDITMGEPTFREVVVDGRPAVLAEARFSWDENPVTDDRFEDTAVLAVDVDGLNALIGIASITETHASQYDAAVDALLATSIDVESAAW